VIKLRTKCDKQRGLVTRDSEGIVNFRANVCHDAAVAHALIRAIADTDEEYGEGGVRLALDTVKRRAIEILRLDFGIDAANGFGEQQ
jgi:hypothetical protein